MKRWIVASAALAAAAGCGSPEEGSSRSAVDEAVVGTPALAIVAARDIASSEGATVSPQLATVAGGKPGYLASVSWGDGTNVDVRNMGSLTDISGPHVYADDGVYQVTVTVTDASGAAVFRTVKATISNVPPRLGALSHQIVGVGRLAAVSTTFSDPGFDSARNGTVETLVATIDWGDGTLEAPPVTVSAIGSPGHPTTGTVTAGHVYSSTGDYSGTVTISDDDGGSATGTFEVSVVPN